MFSVLRYISTAPVVVYQQHQHISAAHLRTLSTQYRDISTQYRDISHSHTCVPTTQLALYVFRINTSFYTQYILKCSPIGLCRVPRVVGYPIIASGTRTEIWVRVPEMLHYGKNGNNI